MKLTVDSTAALKLPAGKADHFFWDDDIPGFGIRVRQRRARWIFQYEIGKGEHRRTRRMSFGTYPAMKVPAARDQAAKLHAAVMLGEDPQALKEDNQARAGETFAACVELYLEWRRTDPKKTLRPSTLGEIERHLTRNLKALNTLRIDKVDRRAIALELTRFAKTGGPVQANRTATSVHKFFRWCIGEGLIEINPATDLNKNPEAPRDRVLSVTELAEVWRALPAGDFGDIIRLLILTGQREREIGDLRWTELNLENATVMLPPERVKNRRKHVFPLSAPAVAILKARTRDDERSLVFGRGNGDRGFSGWSRAKARLDEVLQIPEWVIHDLRRSFSTGLGDLGVPPHVIEMLINHQSGTKGGVSGRYNWSAYEREGRQAVDLWGATLLAAVEGRPSNVTTLKRAG